jgi:hypothetical protein
MEATKYGDCVDAPLCRERSWNRLLVTEGLVRTRFVVKADVLGDDAAEVILTEDEDVVEQLSPERTGEAFSEGIHVRRAYRRAHDAHPRRPEYASEASAELRVVVADDNLWRVVHGGVSVLHRLRADGICSQDGRGDHARLQKFPDSNPMCHSAANRASAGCAPAFALGGIDDEHGPP